MPPRKTSRPPPYAARNQSRLAIPPALKNLLRRDKARVVALGILGFMGILWLFGIIGGGSSSGRKGAQWTSANIPKVVIGSGPPVVIVTVLDPKADPRWTQKIKTNREEYAKRHGTYNLSQNIIYEVKCIANTMISQATSPSSPTTTNTRSAPPLPHGPASPPSGTPWPRTPPPSSSGPSTPPR